MSTDYFRTLVRQAWASLRSRPGLTATVTLSLALGLGANAALFAVVDGAILRPFSFPEPDRLVGVGAGYPTINRPLGFFESLSGPEYVDIRTVSSLTHVAAFDLGNEPVLVGDTPERVFTAFVWDDPLKTIGLPAALGRSFADEELRAVAPVAMVSHTFWQTQLGGDPDAVGRAIHVAGRPHVVIGVMPERTRLWDTDLWVPMAESASSIPRNRRQFNVLARLAPGVSLEQANADLSRLAGAIATAHAAEFQEYEGFTMAARPWTQIEVWGFSGVTTIVFGAVGLLLLLVASNLASLLAAKSAVRRGEMAVRTALGATRRTLMAQLATETLLQTVAGACLGLFLAWMATQSLPTLMPAGLLPADADISLSPRLVMFVLGLALIAAIVVSLAPTIQLVRTAPADVLTAESGRGSGSRSTRRLHQWIVAFQVATAVVVAGSATMLTMATLRLLQVEKGFDSANVLTARFTLPLTKYDGTTSLAFFDTLLERARALPSVVDATLSNQPPPGVFSRSTFAVAGRAAEGNGRLPSMFYSTVGSHYLETLDARLVRGRWLNDTTPVTGPREVVINETLARRYFAGEDPVGKSVQVQGPASDGTWADIVGVVADVRNAGLVGQVQPEMFVSVRQIPDRRRTQVYLAVRTRGEAMTVLPEIRSIVKSIDPGQPMYAIGTIDDAYVSGVATRRVAAWLLTVFSVLAMGLAGLGIYGVLSHAVTSRTREIGLRLALGADGRSVMRLMLGQAFRPVGVGLVAGIAVVLGAQQFLASWLYGTTPEAGPLVLVSALVLVVSLAAAAWPILRASRLSPMVALTRGGGSLRPN
jgi:putative ABC transport system permease protein